MFLWIAMLLGMNRFNRTNICTGTTIGAYIRINFVDVTLRYCFNRTFVNASSASSAIIVDLVSHFYYFWLTKITIIVQNY